MVEAVLFDLDGTVADTALDLGGALNRLRDEEGLAALPMAALRPYVSQGVRGLLKAGFAIAPEHADYERLSERFLALYMAHICDDSVLFDGMAALLDALDAAGIAWGIVTNKRSRFTAPVVEALGLAGRTRAVVSGDTTPEPKPSPRPVLHACELLGVQPGRTLFVGDDLRDIQAGQAAGCITVGVHWGYLGDGGSIDSWGADHLIDHPLDLLDLVRHSAGPTA